MSRLTVGFFIITALASVEPISAQAYHSSVLQVQVEATTADSQRVDSLSNMAATALETGDISKARRTVERLRTLGDSLNFGYARQRALYDYGNLHLVQQQYDSAETVLSQALALSPGPPVLKGIKNLLGTAHRFQGDNQQALRLYREALALVDTTEDLRTAAGISQNMGDAYMNLGNTAEAFKNYNRAITYGEETRDSLFLATTLNNVGNAYNQEEKYEEAASYLERSLEISRALGYTPGELRSLTNLGITRSGQSSFSESEQLFLEALEVSEAVRPNTPPIQIHYNMGELYHRMDDLDKAESYFRRSLEASKNVGMPLGIYYNSAGMGNVAEARGNISDALSWHQDALDIAVKLNNPSMQQAAHQRLYELNKQQDNFEAALRHLETTRELSDSLQTSARNRMLAEYQARLQVQQREQRNLRLETESNRQQAQLELQNWLLIIGGFVIVIIALSTGLLYKANRDKKEINQALEIRKQELEESNDIKNKLFSIVAHDLRTPLSALVGMMELLRDSSLSEEEMRTLFTEMELMLQQNVMIMENLLAWAKQQMSGFSMELQKIKVADVAEELMQAHEFTAQHKSIQLKNELPDELEVKGDYNMFKLVLRNLISNGIKFSKAGDEITIVAERKNGSVVFEVRDTGIGIPEEMQKDIFGATKQSRKGTRNERGSGIGLNLCKEFVEKQGGKIDFESQEGEGTSFYFSLPEAGN